MPLKLGRLSGDHQATVVGRQLEDCRPTERIVDGRSAGDFLIACPSKKRPIFLYHEIYFEISEFSKCFPLLADSLNMTEKMLTGTLKIKSNKTSSNILNKMRMRIY